MKIFIISVILLISTVYVSNSQVAIIANKGVSDASIDASKAGSIYSLSTKKWGNGTSIVVFDMSGGDAKSKFYGFINKNEASLKKDWLKLKLTEGSETPKLLGSDAEMIKMVSSTSGAIGYVSSSSVTGDVKVLNTIK